MARPQKFRHSPEALSDAAIASKLAGLVLEIETLRTQRKAIDDQIAAAYDAVDDDGFEKKFVRKAIALRAKEPTERGEEEATIEAYEDAIERGLSSRARVGNIREAKPEVSAALIETVAAGLQTELGRKALVTAIDIMIEREEEHDPETGEIIETNSPETAPITLAKAGAEPASRDDQTEELGPRCESGLAPSRMPAGVDHVSAEREPAPFNVTIPDDQLVSVRYPDGVRKVPYAEFKRGVAAAQTGARA